jgi:hypothetical protein
MTSFAHKRTHNQDVNVAAVIGCFSGLRTEKDNLLRMKAINQSLFDLK